MSSLLNYNQYAAQALWGSSSGYGSDNLLSLIKSNMLDKTSSLNQNLISKYESKAQSLTNKISYLDNLKSQLAILSTKTQNLAGLKNKVNSDINISQGSSSLITITNDLIIKGQASKPAGVVSNDLYAINVGNYEGTFAPGDYTINVSGDSIYAESSSGFDDIKFGANELGNQKIFELAGYNIRGTSEEVTVIVGDKTEEIIININEQTTINDFLNDLNNKSNIIKGASIDSNGKISIQMNTGLGYQSLSFSSSNTSEGSVVGVLKLDSLASALSNGTIDTSDFQGFYTNFEEVGMSGNFNFAFMSSTNTVYCTTISGEIKGENTYGNETDIILYNSGSEGKNSKIQINEDNFKIISTINNFIQDLSPSDMEADVLINRYFSGVTNFSNYYDTTNFRMEVTLDSNILEAVIGSKQTYSYIDKDGNRKSYTTQNGDNIGKVLQELDLLQEGQTSVDLTQIKSTNKTFLIYLLGYSTSSETSSEVVITFEAKTGDDAPPTIDDKLINYSYDTDSNNKITEGDLIININGSNSSFDIDENTTVDELKEFMRQTAGFTYDTSTKNFKLDSNSSLIGSNIQISGSSSIVNMLKPVIEEYQFEAKIKGDEAGNYYKNLSALGLARDDAITINGGPSIEIKQSWTINQLIDAINNANTGVEASFNDIISSLQIKRTDGYLSYIDFASGNGYSQNFLLNLGFITIKDGVYSTNTNVQTLPDDVTITVQDRDGKSYNIGDKTSSIDDNGVSFSTIVKNMSSNDENVMLGSFNIDVFKLGEHTITVNEATAATPDIVIEDLSGATNIIQMIEKTGNLSSNNYNLKIEKINENQMQISGTDNEGNPLTVQTITKNATDNKFYYTISQYDENGNENGSVTFEVKNDDDFKIGDIRETNIKIETSSNEGGSLEGIEDVINSVNEQIDESNKKIIDEFVNAYNNVLKQASKINNLIDNTTSFSDKMAINELIKNMNNVVNQSEGTYGSIVGFTFGYDESSRGSVLNVDSDKLLNALNENTNFTNYLSNLQDTIVSSIDLFVKGKFASIYSNSNNKLDEFNNRISSLKSKNDELMAKLEADYKIIEQMFNQSSYQYSGLFSNLGLRNS